MSAAQRVLVTGAHGQVGVDLVDTLRALSPPGADASWQRDDARVADNEFVVTALSHDDLDVTKRELVAGALRDSRAQVVVNLAAYTKVDAAESDVTTARALNSDAVGALSELCNEFGAHLITISTDFVFNGTKGSAYVEGDATDPLNVYGLTKRAGELNCSPRDSVLRTSWVLGVRARNVVHVIVDRVSRGESVNFVDDQRGTPTFAADLSRALVTLIRTQPGGLWHFANEGDVSWFEIARAVSLAVTGSDELVHAVQTSELSPAPIAQRPARSDLDTSQWRANGFDPPRAWSDGLARFLSAR